MVRFCPLLGSSQSASCLGLTNGSAPMRCPHLAPDALYCRPTAPYWSGMLCKIFQKKRKQQAASRNVASNSRPRLFEGFDVRSRIILSFLWAIQGWTFDGNFEGDFSAQKERPHKVQEIFGAFS